MSTAPESDQKEISDGFPDLLFIYNKTLDYIELSTSPGNIFPNFTAHTFKESTDFLNTIVENTEKATFHKKWTKCQELNENEVYFFDYKLILQRDKNDLFRFICKGIRNLKRDEQLRIVIILRKADNVATHKSNQPVTRQIDLREELSKIRITQDEFIQLASHDLHAPLRKLTSFSDLLISKIPVEEKAALSKYIEKMEGSVDQMRELLDRLITLSQVSLHKSDAEFQSCDLNAILKNVYDDLNKEMKLNNAEITIQKLPVIDGIPSQLYIMFRNIIENALLYKNKSQLVNISIQSTQIENTEQFLLSNSNNTAYFKISINDNGIGIDKEYLGKLFQPFIRLQGKSDYPGYGLGLAICKRIVDNHFGEINAISDANGSRFIIILPQKH